MPRRVALGLVALVAVGLGVRWVWVLGVDPDVPEQGDASAYHLLAEGLADGEGYVRPYDRVLFGIDRPTAEYPPLHPAVITIAAKAGIHSVTGQRLWLSLFGAASVAATGLLTWRLSGRERATLLAAGVVAVHPLLFQADATLMPEALAGLLGALAVASAIGAAREPTRLTWIVLGATCALAALTRSEGLLLLPLVAVPAVLAGRRRWTAVAVTVVAFAVVVGPWSYRNHTRFQELVPISTNLGSVVDGANCDAAYSGPLLGYWVYSDDCFEGFTQRELNYLDDESISADLHRHAGWHYANQHMGDWPKVVVARLARTVALFRPGQLADLGALEGREQAADLAGYALVWACLPLAVLGALRLRREQRPWWIPAVTVAAIWGATALSYGNPRFLAIAQPSLVGLAACGASKS